MNLLMQIIPGSPYLYPARHMRQKADCGLLWPNRHNGMEQSGFQAGTHVRQLAWLGVMK